MKIKEISLKDEKSLDKCRLLCQNNYLENLVLLGDLYYPCLKLSQVYAIYNDCEEITACFTVFNGFKDPSAVLPYGLSREYFSLIMKFLQETLPDTFGFVSFDISEDQLEEFFKVEDQMSEYCMITETLPSPAHPIQTIAKKATPADYSRINDFYQSINAYAWNSCQLESGFYFIIEDSEEIVACAGTHLETPNLAQLGNIYVHETHRRKGYGQILTSIVSEKILQSKKIVSLFVLQDNTPAITLYKSLGFKVFKPVSIFSLKHYH